MKKLILFLLVVVLYSGCSMHKTILKVDSQPLKIKVLTIAMFEVGKMTGDAPGEAQLWVEREKMTGRLKIPGMMFPVCYNDRGHALMVTQMGFANAASSVMSLGMSGVLDLSKAYIIIAGIAGVDPEKGTLGSAAWAKYIVNGDLAHEFDSREMPKGWNYPYFRLGGSTPWATTGWTIGTEVFKLNGDLAEKAYFLSKNVKLMDSAGAKLYRARYPVGTAAFKSPVVFMGDVLSAGTYWHGKMLSDWADWWTEKWTGDKAIYAMSDMEDSATFTALYRLEKMGLVNTRRVMLLRTASNFDQQYPGQPPQESIAADNGGFLPAVENAYRVGSTVSDEIIKNWDEWK
ncbi:MAG: purine nucleoside permease [Desulfobacteraceae bacterium]|nr:purine nucleoside permease [Desulfobacteraceae bacterium]